MKILEYLDESTKKVVGLIVDKYLEDMKKYQNNYKEHAFGIGLELASLLDNLFSCAILVDNSNFVIKIRYSKIKSLNQNENINLQANNGFINQTKVLQVINFLKRLNDEGLILFAEEKKYPKKFPEFKSWAFEENGTQIFPIINESLNEFIRSRYFSHILPTEILISFKNKGYKTVEKEREEASECIGNLGIITAIAISIVSPFLMTHCSKTSIEETQFNAIIKTIGNSHGNSQIQPDTISIQESEWKK